MKQLFYTLLSGLVMFSCNPNPEYGSVRKKKSGQDPVAEKRDFKNQVTAEFPGGNEELIRYLSDNIEYPETARQDNVQGKVFVEFVVNKDGSIYNARIKRGVREDLDAECLRVINNMPRWQPAINNGKPVQQRFVLPVNFRL